MTAPSILEVVTDPGGLGLSLSPAQRTLLKTIYGLPLADEEERELFRRCTARETYPGLPFGEATVVAGARSGKDSRVGGPMVCYEAVFGGHEARVAKGERATVVLVAQDLRATRVAFGYVKQYLTTSPLLAPQVAEVLAGEITLTNGVTVSCFPCTLRSLRGFSIPVGVMDELAFYRLEGQADSDAEVQASIRRGMVGFGATKLVKISTPYLRSGVLYEDFKRGWGQADPDLLVWRAPTLLMNPSIAAGRLERERRLDPTRFEREYMAEFLEDVDVFLPAAWVDAAVVAGRHELPPRDGVRYVAAVDPSGGGADHFTLAVAHVEGKGADRRVVQDVMRAWGRSRTGPADLEGAVRAIAGIARGYGLSVVHGDRYSASWVVESFRRAGVAYRVPEVRRPGDDEPHYLHKSAAYLEMEPAIAQAKLEVLDHPQLVRELKLLERRPQAGGRVRVDHPAGGRDDHANVLALATALAARAAGQPFAGAAILPQGVGRVGEPMRGGGRRAAAGGLVAALGAWARRYE